MATVRPGYQWGGAITSGRRHSQSSTVPMQAMAAAAAHSLGTVSSKNTALADMTPVAPHLALRLTTPPWRQSRSIWPNRRCCSSQDSRRGELWAAAQAASKMKGVVGSTGKNMPKKPSARLSTASARNSHCSQRGSGGCVVAGGGWGGTDMPRIVPGEQKGKP
jgi:hypothetical protein